MSSIKLNRRLFLKSTGIAAAGAVAGTAIIIAPDGAWALSLTKLDKATAKSLIRMTQDLYPHKMLGDAPYVRVVEGLDKAAAKDDALAKLLTDGVASLNAATGGSYRKAKEAKRIEALKAMEQDPFFQKIRGTVVNGLYDDHEVWKKFGYQGSSAEQGGYIHRGFDDLDWLPKQG